MNKELDANTILSHYRIVSKIGAGGMGEVYLAEDTRLKRRVALKILPADLASNKDRMRRFEQEAIAAAALNHPNIAHIYEICEHDDTHFIAMEFIDGQTLSQLIHYSHLSFIYRMKGDHAVSVEERARVGFARPAGKREKAAGDLCQRCHVARRQIYALCA